MTKQQEKALKILNILCFAVYGQFLSLSGFRQFVDRGPLSFPLYRGLSLPTDSLKVGEVIEQWGDGTHWSCERSIAETFSGLRADEDFVERYGREHGTDGSYEEGIKLFSRVVMRLDGATNVLPVGKILDRHREDAEFISQADRYNVLSWETLDDIVNEKEYSIHDSDFEITAIDSSGEIIIVNVKQIAINR